MKRILMCAVVCIALMQDAGAQTQTLRKRGLGVSFILNDFTTPQRIRSSSLSSVLRQDRWADFQEMDPGLAITYYKGLEKHIDFAGTIGASFLNLPLEGKKFDRESLLLEIDASANFKMLPENYKFNAYLIAGIGASKFRNIYGAFLPLGGGLKANLHNDTQAFLQLQYRIPVTPEANNYHLQVSLGVSGLLGK